MLRPVSQLDMGGTRKNVDIFLMQADDCDGLVAPQMVFTDENEPVLGVDLNFCVPLLVPQSSIVFTCFPDFHAFSTVGISCGINGPL